MWCRGQLARNRRITASPAAESTLPMLHRRAASRLQLSLRLAPHIPRGGPMVASCPFRRLCCLWTWCVLSFAHTTTGRDIPWKSLIFFCLETAMCLFWDSRRTLQQSFKCDRAVSLVTMCKILVPIAFVRLLLSSLAHMYFPTGKLVFQPISHIFCSVGIPVFLTIYRGDNGRQRLIKNQTGGSEINRLQCDGLFFFFFLKSSDLRIHVSPSIQ